MYATLSFVVIGSIVGGLFVIDGWYGGGGENVELWRAPRVRGMLYIIGGTFTLGIAKKYGLEFGGAQFFAYCVSVFAVVLVWLLLAFPLLAWHRARHVRASLDPTVYGLAEPGPLVWVRLVLHGLRAYVSEYDALLRSLRQEHAMELATRVSKFFNDLYTAIGEVALQGTEEARAEALRANVESSMEWFLLDFCENALPSDRSLARFRAGIYVRDEQNGRLCLYAQVIPRGDRTGLPATAGLHVDLPGRAMEGGGHVVCYPRDFGAGMGSAFAPSGLAAGIRLDGSCNAVIVVQALADDTPLHGSSYAFYDGLIRMYASHVEHYVSAHHVTPTAMIAAATQLGDAGGRL